MGQELKKGMRIDLVEVKSKHCTDDSFAPLGSQRVVYPDEVPLQFGDEKERMFTESLVYLLGHYDFGGGMKDVYDVCLYSHEVKRIGCFVVKEVYSNREAETII